MRSFCLSLFCLALISPSLVLSDALFEVPLTKHAAPFSLAPEAAQDRARFLQEMSSPDTQKNSSLLEEVLKNAHNVQYYGNLALGADQKEFSFIFDTGSSWLWVPTKECKKCHRSKKFDTSASLSFAQESKTPEFL